MDSISQFFHMNGYAYYIWPSFGIAAVVMIFMVFISVRSLKRAQKNLMNIQGSSIPQANET